VIIRIFFLCIACTLSLPSYGQQSDSIIMDVDSVYTEDDEEKEIKYYAAPDSTIIDTKAFEASKLRELKNDPNLNYKQLPTVAETLWDRILRWLGQFIDSFFNAAYETNWGRFLLWTAGVALVIALIMLVLKVDAFKMFFSRTAASAKFEVLEENIHEMDFEKLIQESIDQQNFRKAIRLVFLFSLKLLSDRQLILWESGKTNHDYVGELSKADLKKGLNELSFYFDYAWYGNFQVNRDTFNKVQSTFREFKSKLS
jgi:hypothetical protein